MSAVTVQNEGVVVNDLWIANREVVEYVARFPDEERAGAVTRAVEVGVAVLERYESSRNMDFLRQQADAIVAGFNGAVQAIPPTLQAELMKNLGTKDGQALAPVATLVAQAEKILRDKLGEVQSLLSDHIDPRRSDSTLGCALERLKIILDPKHDDSVQKAVDKSLQSVAGEQGIVATVVKKVVEDSVRPLKTTVDELAKEIRGKEAVSEALEQTPAKGRPFEEELLPIIQAWATMIGAEVEHVGPDNQSGDILVVLDSSRMTTADLRIVIEARDDQCSRGKKRILDDVGAALAARKADYGLYVARSASGLAKEIGDWAELQCAHGPVIACTAEHLRTALRFAVVQHRLRQLKAATPKTDVAAIQAEVERIRCALGRIRTINTKATSIRTGADAISSEATELKRETSEALYVIEEALRTVQDAEAMEVAAGAEDESVIAASSA
jgi:hypothetical protein